MQYAAQMAAEAGRDYPSSYAGLRAWFSEDAACLDWLRWPEGFCCPRCESVAGWRTVDSRWSCGGCARRVSATSGTIFHRTRTPLTVWFAAGWLLTSSKSGVAAVTVQRQLDLGSYQTAWAMLHRFRTAMVRPGRERLTGRVEVDETFIGGVKPGKRGRGAAGKAMVAIAVEQHEPRGFGRIRLQVIDNAQAPTLRAFLLDHVEPGATVVTDGLRSYPPAVGEDYDHDPFNVAGSGLHAHIPLPAVHRVASLLKRWLLGTHQGAIEADHLQAYLDEFVFRFNRRHSNARGLLFYRLLQQAVATEPITYRDLVANPAPRPDTHAAPPGARSNPASLDIGQPGRPWRAAGP